MQAPPFPAALEQGIDRLVERLGRSRLELAARRLSEAYRSQGETRVARSAEDAAAYAATRAPATFASAGAVLEEVTARRPGWQPRTLLDVGAGPGVASWAALALWPGIERVTLVEAEAEMADVGRELARGAPAVLSSAEWRVGDLLEATGSYDLVVASYVLNELAEPRVADVAASLWARTADTLVVAEPGTPLGYRRVLAARSAAMSAGGFTLAPCPHDAPCPLTPPDWCHFAVRLERGGAHRAVKAVSRGFEDEKLSYAVLTREAVPRSAARIIRQPQIRKGHVHLELCERDGLSRTIVSKREPDEYRRARKAGWGDAWR